MIEKMNLEKDKNYLFVTPYRTEIDRIVEKCGFKTPELKNKFHTRLDDLHDLLESSENIVMTHALFLLANKKTEKLILDGDYVLILDESLEVLHDYNQDMKKNTGKIMDKDDPDFLIRHGFIHVDEKYNVKWVNEEENSKSAFHYSEVKRLADRGMLRYINGKFYWEYPPDIFQWFSKIYVLTYLFENTVLDCYFKVHNMSYTKVSAKVFDDGFALCNYSDSVEQRKEFATLINIYEGEYNDLGMKPNSFSINWLRKCSPDRIETIKKAMRNYKNSVKASNESVMWTTTKQFGIYKKFESAKGFKLTRRLKSKEKSLPEKELNKLKQFVPCNIRATNDYSNRTVLMYMLDYRLPPDYANYFSAQGYNLNMDQISLSVLIQWIWRSAIRNGQPISVFIPSRRMRNLLREWLLLPAA